MVMFVSSLEVIVELRAGPGPVERVAGGAVPVLECEDSFSEAVESVEVRNVMTCRC